MTRTRRIVGAGLASLATMTALAFAGQGFAAERPESGTPGLSPQRLASTLSPTGDDSNGSRGRRGYGQEVPSVPPGEVPSVPPGEVPSPPPGEVPSVPPGEVPQGGGLPVTGVPMATIGLLGVLLAIAGAGMCYLARRRRVC